MAKYDKKLTLVLPAYNEEQTIASVIIDFHKEIPGLIFCVVDNNSSDRTSEVVLETYEKLGIAAGNSILLHEKRQGKGQRHEKGIL